MKIHTGILGSTPKVIQFNVKGNITKLLTGDNCSGHEKLRISQTSGCPGQEVWLDIWASCDRSFKTINALCLEPSFGISPDGILALEGCGTLISSIPYVHVDKDIINHDQDPTFKGYPLNVRFYLERLGMEKTVPGGSSIHYNTVPPKETIPPSCYMSEYWSVDSESGKPSNDPQTLDISRFILCSTPGFHERIVRYGCTNPVYDFSGPELKLKSCETLIRGEFTD